MNSVFIISEDIELSLCLLLSLGLLPPGIYTGSRIDRIVRDNAEAYNTLHADARQRVAAIRTYIRKVHPPAAHGGIFLLPEGKDYIVLVRSYNIGLDLQLVGSVIEKISVLGDQGSAPTPCFMVDAVDEGSGWLWRNDKDYVSLERLSGANGKSDN